MIFYTSSKGEEVYGNCQQGADGVTNYCNKTLCNINFSVRWQHGTQSCVIMAFTVASGSVESSITNMRVNMELEMSERQGRV